VGAFVEWIGGEAARDISTMIFVGYHPGQWKIEFGLGAEFTRVFDEAESAARIGLSYEFEVGSRFTLEPEFNFDYVEGGKITLVYGASLGLPF